MNTDTKKNSTLTAGDLPAAASSPATALYEHEPTVTVGIVSGEQISFVLNQPYRVGEQEAVGQHTVVLSAGSILWQGRGYEELVFRPLSAGASFSLRDVTIGVNFHWERRETQTFLGALHLIVLQGSICAVNELPVESYLASVISSEMRATSSVELLKAHAVISRSWLLAQMERRHHPAEVPEAASAMTDNEEQRIRWYDREDHTAFDVCADDHCQRYQGITKETSRHVAEAVEATRGQILMACGSICDARFSKCCGGVSEEYQYCWEDEPKSYLQAIRDDAEPGMPDLTVEENADRWIRSNAPAFCNTTDRHVLEQVLNDYDQETADFYRWHISYTQQQLAGLIRRKLGLDFGSIVDLVPLERGRSGRLSKLRIVGTERSMVIGKELEIRRALSESHLYSSAFVVDTADFIRGIPQKFDIIGAGWGHGVGLCQIGAAVMGEKGYRYDEILLHYYKGADIRKIYE